MENFNSQFQVDEEPARFQVQPRFGIKETNGTIPRVKNEISQNRCSTVATLQPFGAKHQESPRRYDRSSWLVTDEDDEVFLPSSKDADAETTLLQPSKTKFDFDRHGTFPACPEIFWRIETASYTRFLRSVLDAEAKKIIVVSSGAPGLCKASAVCELFYHKQLVEKLVELSFTGSYWWDLSSYEEDYFDSECFVTELTEKISPKNGLMQSRNLLVLEGFPTSKVNFLIDRYAGEQPLRAIVITRRSSDLKFVASDRVTLIKFQKLTKEESKVLVQKSFSDERSHSIVEKLSMGLPFLTFMLRNLSYQDLTILSKKLLKKGLDPMRVLRKIVNYKMIGHLVCGILPYKAYQPISESALSTFSAVAAHDYNQFVRHFKDLNLRRCANNSFYFGCQLLFDFAWASFRHKFKEVERIAISGVKELYERHSAFLSGSPSHSSLTVGDVEELYHPEINILKYLENIAGRHGTFFIANAKWLKSIFPVEAGFRAITQCAEKGYFELLKWLLQEKLYKASEEVTMIFKAIEGAALISRNVKIVAYLFGIARRSSNIKVKLRELLRVVYLNCAENGNWAILIAFIRSQATDIACQGPDGETALYYAIKHNYQPMSSYLASSRVPLGSIELYRQLCRDYFLNSETSLDFRSYVAFVNLVQRYSDSDVTWDLYELLLKEEYGGIVLELLKSGKITPTRDVIRAILRSGIKVLSDYLIKEQGFGVNCLCTSGCTFLTEAVAASSEQLAKGVIDCQGNVDFSDSHGKTPLYLAVERGSRKMVEFLLDRNANQLAESAEGCSALEVATCKHCHDVVDSLLRRRPQSESSMLQNFRALAIADEADAKSIIQIIRQSEMPDSDKLRIYKAVLQELFENQAADFDSQIDQHIQTLLRCFRNIWPSYFCQFQDILKWALFLAAEMKKPNIILYLVINQNVNVAELNDDEETIVTSLLQQTMTATDEQNLAELIDSQSVDGILATPNRKGDRPLNLAANCGLSRVIAAIMNRKVTSICKDDRKLVFNNFLETDVNLFGKIVDELEAENLNIALDCAIGKDSIAGLVCFKKVKGIPWLKIYERAKFSRKLKIISFMLDELLVEGVWRIELEKELAALIEDGSLDIIRLTKNPFRVAVDDYVNDKPAIVQAVEKKDRELVEELLSWSPRIQSISMALQTAVKLEYVEIAFLILKYCKEKDERLKDKPDQLKEIMEEALARADNGQKSIVTFISEIVESHIPGRTLLVAAVEGKYTITSLRLLIDCLGCDINAQNSSGETALHIAVKRNYLQAIELLLDRSASTEITDNSGRTAIYVAVENQLTDIVNVFKDKCPSCSSTVNIGLQQPDNTVKSPISVAFFEHRNFEIVRLLKAMGATIDEQSYAIAMLDGHRQLSHTSLTEKHDCIVKHFVEDLGADVNIANSETGETMLMSAVRNRDSRLVECLLQNGADKGLEIRNREGRDAAVLAVIVESSEILALLLNAGADVNTCEVKVNDSSGAEVRSLLVIAVERGLLEIVQLLMGRPGIEVNVTGSPLIKAIRLNRVDILAAILSHMSTEDVCNHIDSDRNSILAIAVLANNVKAVNIILEDYRQRKISFHSANIDGETALTKAIKAPKPASLKSILSQMSADVIAHQPTDNSGNNALATAIIEGHTEAIDEILGECVVKSGVEKTAIKENKDGVSPFFLAVECQNDDVLAKILEKCIQSEPTLLEGLVNLRSPKFGWHKGASALKVAVANDNSDAVKLLFEHGAYINEDEFSGDALSELANSLIRLSECQSEVLKKRAEMQLNCVLRIAGKTRDVDILKLILSSNVRKSIAADELRAAIDAIVATCITLEQLLDMLNLFSDLKDATGILREFIRNADKTALLMAALNGRFYDLVKFLLEFKAELNGEVLDSALLEAVRGRDVKTVELLLAGGVKINSALVLAVTLGYSEIVETLLTAEESKQGADRLIAVRNAFGDNVLAVAVRCANAEIVKLVLDKIQDSVLILNDFKCFGSSPLTMACLSLNTEIIKLLFDKGADPSANLSSEADNLLLTVIRHFNTSFVYDFDIGDDILSANSGWPPIDKAVEVIELLLSEGVSLYECDEYGNNALLLACASSNFNKTYNLPLEMARCLCKSISGDPSEFANSPNKQGISPLMVSLLLGNVELCQFLKSMDNKTPDKSEQ